MNREFVALGELLTVSRNGVNADQFDQPTEDMLPISRIETISDGIINFIRVKYAKLGLIDKKKYLLQSGDILFSHINSPDHIGKTAIYRSQEPLLHGINLLLLRPNHNLCYPEYLNYYFKTKEMRDYFKTHCKKAVNQASLNQNDLLELIIPLPPLPEQQRIAAILQKADRLRNLRKYARQLSDGYLQSVFLEMFGDSATNPMGWEKGNIDDVIRTSQYGTSTKSNNEQKGFPILGMGNITYSGLIDLSSIAFVELSERDYQDLKLEKGDIVFNRTNSTELVGKTALWDIDQDAVLASYLIKLKVNQKVTPEFLCALLNTQFYKNLYRERCKKAIGQSNISPTLLREFPVFIPPINLQKEYSDKEASSKRLFRIQIESERQGETLFQSLLQQAFQGEL